jgi:hypothetical protein
LLTRVLWAVTYVSGLFRRRKVDPMRVYLGKSWMKSRSYSVASRLSLVESHKLAFEETLGFQNIAS